jgi:hypothetical protein
MNEYKSTELNEIFSALSKAQEEIKVAVKDANNPFFKSKYANLQAVIESSRPALCKNNLAVTQQIIPNEQGIDYLVTTLCHSSGQWISSSMKINPAKADMQSLGSSITYARRYSYASLVGVYDGEEDDDGTMACAPSVTHTSRSVQPSLLSEDQVDILEIELRGYPTVKQSLLNMLNISDLKFMEKVLFNDMLKKVREIIAGHVSAKK